jgi:hypothetical protein
MARRLAVRVTAKFAQVRRSVLRKLRVRLHDPPADTDS